MIPVDQAHLFIAAGTDQGLQGKNNEDVFSVSAYQLSENDPTPVVFVIIADGIGGHHAGEVAASIAVEMISDAVAKSDGSQPTSIMQAAIIQASQAILAQSQKDIKKKGMGTTCVCTWIIADHLFISSVGNSRIYLIKRSRMLQINIDHTWVQEGIESGALTREQARAHPNANIIRRYLGSRNPVEVDLRLRLHPDDFERATEKNQGMRIQPRQRLLLCSDGLSDLVDDKEIYSIMKTLKLDDTVPALIDLANKNGGKDNITAIALEMPKLKRFSLF